MPTTNLPVPADFTVDLQEWDFWKQFPFALRERAQSVGNEFWPGCSEVADVELSSSLCPVAPQYTGKISTMPESISAGTLYKIVDLGKTWDVDRWYDYAPPIPDSYTPAFYDIVIENDEYEPWGVVRARIVSNDADFLEVEAGPIDDAVAALRIPSIAALSGRRYCIVRRQGVVGSSIHWDERMPVWPNCREYAKGFVTAAGNTYITESGAKKEYTVTPGASIDVGDTFTLVVNPGNVRFAAISTDGTAAEIVKVLEVFWNGSTKATPKLVEAINEGGVLRLRSRREGFEFTLGRFTTNVPFGSPDQDLVIDLVQDNVQAQAFPPGRFAPDAPGGPFELMVRAGGRLKRIAITGNTEFQILFAAQSFTPDGLSRYAVIPAGGRWRDITPRYADVYPKYYNQPSQMDQFLWYSGHQEPTQSDQSDPRYYSRYPDGIIRAVPMATDAMILDQYDGSVGSCMPTIISPIMDVDVKTDVQDECTEADFFHAPFIHHSFRGWQVAAQLLCYEFVEDKSYDNLSAIPNFLSATWWKAANVNHFTTTVSGHAADAIYLAGSLPASWLTSPDRTEVWFTILDADGNPVMIGELDALSPEGRGNVVGSMEIEASGLTDAHHGLTIVISPGWSRKFPKEFRYLYDAEYFVPDYDNDGTYDPPTAAYPGTWITRPKSTAYKFYSNLGFATDAGTPSFQDGDVARYVGDNVLDPTTSDNVQAGISPDTFYRDLAVTQARPYDESFEGVATAAGKYWIEDSTKAWWEKVLYAHSGTATGGGAGTMTDTAKATDALWGARSHVGGILEKITGGVVAARVPITGHVGTTVTWDPTTEVSFAAGDAYRIREPGYVKNGWKGRTVQIVTSKGKVYSRPILYSDDQRLYFEPIPEVTFAAGDRFMIVEIQPGAVLKYAEGTTSWAAPTGLDPRGAMWVRWSNNNDPHTFLRFGRFRKGDIVYDELLNSLWRGIQELCLIKKTGIFGENLADTYDTKSGGGQRDRNPGSANYGTWEDAQGIAEGVYTASSGYYEVENPFAFRRQYVSGNDSPTISGSRSSDLAQHHWWAHLDYVPTIRFMHTVEVYVYTGMDVADTDPFDTGTVREFFDPLGFNVYFRKWGKITEAGPSLNAAEVVKVGDATAISGDWPADPSEVPDGSGVIMDDEKGGWSAVGQPLMLLRFNVVGGYQYQ